MDDAHLAENAAHSLYSLDINRREHGALFSALIGALAMRFFPHYSRLSEYAAGDSAGFGIIEHINLQICATRHQKSYQF